MTFFSAKLYERMLAMLFSLKQCFSITCLIFALSFLAACTPAEQQVAIEQYKKAVAEQDISAIALALKSLSKFSPEKYQKELQVVSKATQALTRAEKYQLQNDTYQLYLAAHESFRAYPVKANKALLIESGKKLQWLIEVEKYIQKSIELLPEDILAVNSDYQQESLSDWDVIQVNTLIERLGNSANFLVRVMKLVEKNKVMLPSDLSHLLRDSIQSQYERVIAQQSAIIDIAFYHSASQLQKLNDQLYKQASFLLSQVESRFAMTEMKTLIQKAEHSFAPYTLLIENLSLASAMKNGNEHANWYQSWQQVEQPVFDISESVEDYIKQYQHRRGAISTFTTASRLVTPELWHINRDEIFSSNQAAIKLLNKLNKDKTIISYGLSKQ